MICILGSGDPKDDDTSGAVALEDGRRLVKRDVWHRFSGNLTDHWTEPFLPGRYKRRTLVLFWSPLNLSQNASGQWEANKNEGERLPGSSSDVSGAHAPVNVTDTQGNRTKANLVKDIGTDDTKSIRSKICHVFR